MYQMLRCPTGPVVLLGQFHPTAYDHAVIREEFRAYLAKRVKTDLSTGYIEVRDPEFNLNLCTSEASKWHHDGVLQKYRLLLVLWSNATPTEIKLLDGEPIRWVRPYDVVLLDNDACVHRRPDAIDEDRWFARIVLQKEARLDGTLNEF